VTRAGKGRFYQPEEIIMSKPAKGNKKSTTRKKGLTPRVRPKDTFGVTKKMKTGCGNLYITINEDENGLCEVFTTMGKSGGCAAAHTEAVSRMISMALRSGVKPEPIIRQLCGIRCPKQIIIKGGSVLSCPDAIGKALADYIGKPVPKESIIFDSGKSPECPECSGLLQFIEGCMVCKTCGFSDCD
jgi:ribonucleoside-diphosphate reductase alpha chain